MAATLDVKGKSTIQINTGAAWVDIGIAPSDASFAISEERFEKTIHTNESGPDIPAAILNLGTMAVITAPLIKFDRSLMDEALKNVGAENAGELGDLGDEVRLYQIRITPTKTGARRYTFPRARIEGAPQEISNQWSVEEDQALLTFRAYANFLTLSTATTAVYTVDTV